MTSKCRKHAPFLNLNQTVWELLRRNYLDESRRQPEDNIIAFEFEMEGRGLGGVAPGRNWVAKPDGSLRGDSMEFVSAKPFTREQFPKSLRYLRKKLDESATVVPSDRCSVHVHLNFQDRTILELSSFMILWYIVEEFMSEYSGPDRAGNTFCMRAVDSVDVVSGFLSYLRTGRFPRSARYVALNYMSLAAFGSLEVRTFRGVADPVEAETWANLLLELYDVSTSAFKNPEEVLQELSEQGPSRFIRRYLPKIWEEVFSGYPQNLVDERVMVGVRCVQELAYSIDWEATSPRKKSRTKITLNPAAPAPDWM